jgi:hypothetical protein
LAIMNQQLPRAGSFSFHDHCDQLHRSYFRAALVTISLLV